MRLTLTALLLLTSLLHGGAVAGSPAGQPPLPDAVQGLLPSGARATEAFLTDLTDDGADDWAIMAAIPHAGAAFATDLLVVVVVASPAGWQIAMQVTEEYAPGGTIARAQVGGQVMLQVTVYVGAHAGSLSLYRWDGSAFGVLLREGSNTPAFDVTDSTVIAWFSPYCGSYAVSPVLFRAHWWDGAGFVRDDGRDPLLIQQVRTEFVAALSGTAGETAAGRACLWDALAYLDRAAGDAAAVGQDCEAARREEPEAPGPRLMCD